MSDQQTTCPLCRGTGNCPECGGLGRLTCVFCDGLGCKECDSTGTVTCVPCNGGGRCWRCDGRGEVTVPARFSV